LEKLTPKEDGTFATAKEAALLSFLTAKT